MRLIDADALISDLEHDVKMDEDSLIYEDLTNENRGIIQFDKDCKQNAIDLLHHTPTIESPSAEKTGKWISELKVIFSEFGDDVSHDVKMRWYCSECGHTIGLCWEDNPPTFPKYCCDCGAKMGVEHE